MVFRVGGMADIKSFWREMKRFRYIMFCIYIDVCESFGPLFCTYILYVADIYTDTPNLYFRTRLDWICRHKMQDHEKGNIQRLAVLIELRVQRPHLYIKLLST